jgi:hypothetical protein
MRALLTTVALLGYNIRGTYECVTDADCRGGGASAQCEPTQFCSFDDDACGSGRRYDDHAGGALAGACLDGEAPDAGVPDGAQAPNCPAGYLLVGALPGGYRYSTTGAMWLAAETDCEDDGVGTHLAIVSADPENDALESVVGTTRVWIGVTDRVTADSYLTVTNDVQLYLPWEADEPDPGEDYCLTVKATEFADEDCTDVRPYLCECDGVAAVPASY